MRSSTRVPIAVASLAVASLAVVACSSGGTSSDTDASGGADDVELRMTIWSANPDHVAAFQELGDEFAEQNDRVASVTIESFNLADLDTLVTTQISAGDAPDVSWLPVESSAEYIKSGALVDLRETIDKTEGFDFDDFIPSLLERWEVDDAVYGIPFSTGPLIMYYNKDLYAQAGIKDPGQLIADGDWTWDTFRETSKQLTDKLGVPGYALNDFDFKNWTRLLPFLNAYDASPWNEDATECTLDSDEAVDALSVFHGMTFDDGSMPVPGQQVDFWGGGAAATSAFLGSAANLSEVDFDWGIAPTPAGPAGDVVATGQASIVAFAAGNHTEEATELVAFLGSKDAMSKYSGFFPPIRESVLTPEVLTQNSDVLTPEAVEPIIEGIKENGKVFPVTESNAAVTDALNSSLDEAFYQPGVDVKPALSSVCEAVEPLLP
ncbi:sugar ABC transporter substrate-binding protein [Microbacterium sp. YMB-B2]|uniref:Sugar ABC transporter substrate-binding protein n=1 Tax=Microbacterium tenebrionis TaxID=2830665 RepID=A0A9X1LLV0_9MICO|nr:sugar ABC transporter substrate-binding protein [Microbacterium tenebrionis]MCC2028075.1 sugar ABC transporter substrate-binding protein [Microbacterium tenebrionis]